MFQIVDSIAERGHILQPPTTHMLNYADGHDADKMCKGATKLLGVGSLVSYFHGDKGMENTFGGPRGGDMHINNFILGVGQDLG